MSKFEDDDDQIVRSNKNASAASTSTAAVDNSDLDLDWNDTDATTTGDGLDRITPPEGGKVRCALLVDVVKPKKAWVHFVRKPDGSKVCIRCHSKRGEKNKITHEAACCKRLNADDQQRAQLMIGLLALKYLNADPQTGKYEKDPDTNQFPPIRWKLGWLKLSPQGMGNLRGLVLEGEEPTDFDFTVGKKGQSKGYEYVRVSKNSARFRTNEALLAEVLAEAKTYEDGVALSKRLGRVITEIDLKALLAGQAASNKVSGDIDNTDDL